MTTRRRPIVLKVPVTAEERGLIEEKMRQSRITNFSAYARKMLIDGYVIQVDYGELQTVSAELHRIGVNLNQIAKRLQATGNIYDADVAEIKEMMEQAWRLLRSNLSGLPND